MSITFADGEHSQVDTASRSYGSEPPPDASRSASSHVGRTGHSRRLGEALVHSEAVTRQNKPGRKLLRQPMMPSSQAVVMVPREQAHHRPGSEAVASARNSAERLSGSYMFVGSYTPFNAFSPAVESETSEVCSPSSQQPVFDAAQPQPLQPLFHAARPRPLQCVVPARSSLGEFGPACPRAVRRSEGGECLPLSCHAAPVQERHIVLPFDLPVDDARAWHLNDIEMNHIAPSLSYNALCVGRLIIAQ